jgi:hypothetical protein
MKYPRLSFDLIADSIGFNLEFVQGSVFLTPLGESSRTSHLHQTSDVHQEN